jgi:hypothetical protein
MRRRRRRARQPLRGRTVHGRSQLRPALCLRRRVSSRILHGLVRRRCRLPRRRRLPAGPWSRDLRGDLRRARRLRGLRDRLRVPARVDAIGSFCFGSAGMPRSSLTVAVAALVLLAAVACHRAAGTCELDVDCAAGFDCHAGRCTAREPLVRPTPAPSSPPPLVPATTESPVAPPPLQLLPAPEPAHLPSASPRRNDPPASDSAEPSAPFRPDPKLPAWKLRLRNS